jgi:UDP-2,3-diacylglucosamine pyrophosphatase LpxH
MATKKYLKDYDLVETEDEKGRSRKTAVYHGDYFRLHLEESQIKQLKLKLALFFVAAVACMFVPD